MRTVLLIFAALAFTPTACPAAKRVSLPGGLSTLPTPWVIAHRGGPLLWPESTMEAYRASTASGNPFVEVDCHLLKGEQSIGVMHDASLERTANEKKYVGQLTAREWKQLRIDGHKLLGPGWGSYEAPFFDEILATFGNKKIIFAEAKDGRSGTAIVSLLHRYGISNDHVVVNAFQESQLKAARSAGYLTCLNMGDLTRPVDALRKAGYWAVLIPYAGPEKTADYIRQLKVAGIKALSLADRQSERDELVRCGIDGFYTDDPLYLDGSGSYRVNADPYATQRWAAGMLAAQPGGRGQFTAPNKWGVDASSENTYLGCLQGWMCPIGGKLVAPAWTLEISITFGRRLQDGRWASVGVFTTDAALNNDLAPARVLFGYNLLFYNTGGMALYRYDGIPGRSPTLLKEARGPAIAEGETVRYRIAVADGQITAERVDGKASLIMEDKAYRGAYVTLGAKGQKADFSVIKLTNAP